MTTDGDEVSARPVPARSQGEARQQAPTALNGTVLCLFDGADTSLPRLRLAAAAALASDRRLVVAHVERVSSGFWAAAFTGYGACLGPAERLLTTTAEAAFASAVEGLIDFGAGWDFASCRGRRGRALKRLAYTHNSAVIVVERQDRLFRRLAKNERLTLLAAT